MRNLRDFVTFVTMRDRASRAIYAALTCLPADELAKRGIHVDIELDGSMAIVYTENSTAVFCVAGDEKLVGDPWNIEYPVFTRQIEDVGGHASTCLRQVRQKYYEAEKAERNGRDVPHIEDEWPSVLKTLWHTVCTLESLDDNTVGYLPAQYDGKVKLEGCIFFHKLPKKKPLSEPAASTIMKWMAS